VVEYLKDGKRAWLAARSREVTVCKPEVIVLPSDCDVRRDSPVHVLTRLAPTMDACDSHVQDCVVLRLLVG
jgi:hypothetical protein